MTVTDPLTSAPLEMRPLMKGVADRLQADFSGIFASRRSSDTWRSRGTRYLERRSPPSSLCSWSGSHDRGFGLLRVWKARAAMRGHMSCSSASTTLAAPRWRQGGCNTSLEIRSRCSQAARTRASVVNPAAVEAMAEIGVDISSEFPKPWTDEVVRAADVIVTMGCGDSCPIFPGKRYLDWEVGDPAGLSVAEVRPIRDGLGERVQAIMRELDIPSRASTSN